MFVFAVIVRYIGPGKKSSGDWCFKDGFITFSDIAQCYQENFKGKLLKVSSDCSFGGYWVRACMEYLEEHGVKPCAHSAKEKQLLISTRASCKHTEIPFQLLCSIRANTNDKNNGTLGKYGNGWEVTEGQHIKLARTDSIECSNKSIDESCALGPNETWRQLLNSDRIYMVRGMDQGRPAWHYVLLVDDEETIRIFKERTQGPNSGKYTVNVNDYGQVLKSGFGQDPPNEVKEWMKENYGAC